MSKRSLGGGSSSSISTPRVWGMGARTPWLCAGVCVEGEVRGMERERDEETAGVQLNENKQVTSYNALQLVYHKVRVLYSRKLLWGF